MHQLAPAPGPDSASLTELSATELARLIRERQVTSVAVVEAHIQRLQAWQPRLNAVVVPLYEQALADAAAADAALARGEQIGPLHGVPVTIKESFDVAGTPGTAGLPVLAETIAQRDGPLVARLRAAGAIVLAKTNVPQLLLYFESDNPVYGRTNNPWDQERTPGGSTGGEGAVLAAGGSPLGLGSDVGGSLRVPAHFCGIHSIKATEGRITTTGAVPILPGFEAILVQPGPMARTVADLELGLQLLAAPGMEQVDPAVPPVPLRDVDAVSLKGMRIGVFTDNGYFPPSPGVARAVRDAAAALQEAGAEVGPFSVPAMAECMALYFGLLSGDGAAWARTILAGGAVDKRIGGLVQAARLPAWLRRLVAGLLELSGQRYLPDVVRHIAGGSGRQYWELTARRAAYRSSFQAAMTRAGYDALICPPFALPALRHGGSEHLLAPAGSYAMLFNLLGMPAGVLSTTRVRPGEESERAPSRDAAVRAAIATEQGSAGLPLGVQVAAPWWREDVVLAIMRALEAHFRHQPDYPARPIAPF